MVTLATKIIRMTLTTKGTFKIFALCFGLIFTLSITAGAQTTAENEIDSLDQKRTGKNAITIAYFGETLTHPGLSLGIEHTLWEKKKKKLITSANIGWYTHPRHHHAAFLNIEGGIDQLLNMGCIQIYFWE